MSDSEIQNSGFSQNSSSHFRSYQRDVTKTEKTNNGESRPPRSIPLNLSKLNQANLTIDTNLHQKPLVQEDENEHKSTIQNSTNDKMKISPKLAELIASRERIARLLEARTQYTYDEARAEQYIKSKAKPKSNQGKESSEHHYDPLSDSTTHQQEEEKEKANPSESTEHKHYSSCTLLETFSPKDNTHTEHSHSKHREYREEIERTENTENETHSKDIPQQHSLYADNSEYGEHSFLHKNNSRNAYYNELPPEHAISIDGQRINHSYHSNVRERDRDRERERERVIHQSIQRHRDRESHLDRHRENDLRFMPKIEQGKVIPPQSTKHGLQISPVPFTQTQETHTPEYLHQPVSPVSNQKFVSPQLNSNTSLDLAYSAQNSVSQYRNELEQDSPSHSFSQYNNTQQQLLQNQNDVSSFLVKKYQHLNADETNINQKHQQNIASKITERGNLIGNEMSMLNCVHCKSSFNQEDNVPLCLTCGHFYCKECVCSFFDYQQKAFVCPQDSYLTQNHLQNLPILKPILEQIKQRQSMKVSPIYIFQSLIEWNVS